MQAFAPLIVHTSVLLRTVWNPHPQTEAIEAPRTSGVAPFQPDQPIGQEVNGRRDGRHAEVQ
jgi:hypothetical protein